MSQETSADVVQEALSLGMCGYVVKSQAQSDLFAAVDAVLEGRQFLSGGLSVTRFTDEMHADKAMMPQQTDQFHPLARTTRRGELQIL